MPSGCDQRKSLGIMIFNGSGWVEIEMIISGNLGGALDKLMLPSSTHWGLYWGQIWISHSVSPSAT